MIYKKTFLSKNNLILIVIILLIISAIFIKFVKPSRESSRKLSACQSKVVGWENDCYKTCKPRSDEFMRCGSQDCRNNASLLLNYCNESCRSAKEADKNKCYTEFENNNPLRSMLTRLGL